tara:strand:+ start:181 stop:822 length:642 start_codon:yes stop_codon:yes gene_type:complete
MKAHSTGGGGWNPEDGSYGAVCIMVIDCGMWEREYMGQTKTKRELYIRFELPEAIIPEGEYEGKPAGIGQRYTFSMFKKANLRRDLETWRGRPFTDEQADDFDVATIAGQSATLQVYTNDKGYCNLNLITPYSGSLTASEDILVFDTEDYSQEQFDSLPEWIRKKINLPDDSVADEYSSYDDEQESNRYEREQQDTHQTTRPEMDDFDDDIPF